MNHNIVHKEIFSSDATLLFIGMSKELVQQLSEDEPKFISGYRKTRP